MKPLSSHSSHQTATGRAAPRRARLRTVLLATSALASVALSTTMAHAGDATWGPGDNNFNNDANWRTTGGDPATTPIFNDTATFDGTGQTQIQFTRDTSIGKISVNAGDYSFDTQGHAVTFIVDGLSAGDSASIVFHNAAGGVLSFEGPGSAQGNVIINNDGELHYFNAAASGTINSLGSIQFIGAASSLSDASITLLHDDTHDGSLDVSQVTSSTVTIGSLAGAGQVFLGKAILDLGGNNRSTVSAAVFQDGDLGGGTPGGLEKLGTGTFTMTATSTYTGATFVDNGKLIVDGSIASSSGVNVAPGATLGGTGTVASTAVNGGTLAPGHDDGHGVLTGTLTVAGDLTFSPNATYSVQLTPTDNTRTDVIGMATLSGATVKANLTAGAFVPKQFTILTTTDGVNGKFGSLVIPGLSPIFAPALSYDPDNTKVFLTLTAVSSGGGGGTPGSGGGISVPGFNTNQNNVANGLANSQNLMGGLTGAFILLTTPQSVTQVSGETAVGTQQATFDAMNQFMSVLLDPTLGVRGGQPKDALAAMPRKAAPFAEPFDSRWGVWAAGFGGSQNTSGDASLGSNKTTSNVFGSAVGVDYRFSPNTVAGFALAGGGTHFNVANGGSGNSDLFQAGAYLKHSEGAAFIAAALAYGWQDVTTSRNVTVFGIDNLRGNFKTNAISGRLEGGYRVATAAGDVTPYAAAQFTNYRLPSYMEQVGFGAGTFALNYAGKDVTATRSELGLRAEKAMDLTDATLTLRGRLAWARDFNTDRNVQATFQALPGSAFVVNGAAPAADTALTTIAAETLWRNGWSTSVTADAQLSDTTHSYSGKGVVRYSW
jgi:autotransporter-associated beta strand protein